MNAVFTANRLPFVPILLAYIAGILMYVFCFNALIFKVLWIVLTVITVIALCLSWIARKKTQWTFLPKILPYLLFADVVVVGLTLTATFDIKQDKQWFGHHPEQYEAFAITIKEAPQEKARTILLPAEVNLGLQNNQWYPLKGRLQVYVYKNEALPDFLESSQWILPSKMVSLQHNNNPGSFNFAQKQQREGLYYQCFLAHKDMMPLEKARASSWLAKTRIHLLQQLDTYIKDPTTKTLTQATLLNEVEGMDAQMQEDYANTGISHIIAISGMHVNLLFMVFMLPLFWLKDKRYLWVKYVVVLPFVWIYVALCNFPPSAVRAALGFSLITITLLFKRPQNNIHLLSMNAFVLLVVNPMWLFHIGVQLSFLAVLSILIFYPVMKQWFSSKYLILNLIWDTIAVSLAVQVLVFPLVIYYFHQFPIWFLLANVLAAGFSLLQMMMAFVIMLSGILHLSTIASGIGLALEKLTLFFNAIIAKLNQLSPDLSRFIPLDAFDYWLLMLSIVLLCIYWLRKSKWTLYLGLASVLGFVCNVFLQDVIAARQNRLIVYAGTRQTTVDRIVGKKVWSYTDSTVNNVEKFALKPSHLHFRISERENDLAKNSMWEIGGQKVVLLKDVTSLPDVVPNVIILSKSFKNIDDIQSLLFEKSKIVLDASFGRSASVKLATQLRQDGFDVHNIQEDGAWWIYAK